jgi:hypothetical protein
MAVEDVRLVLALWAQKVCTDTKGDNDHEANQKGPSANSGLAWIRLDEWLCSIGGGKREEGPE